MGTFTIVESHRAEDARELDDQIDHHNIEVTGQREFFAMTFVVHDANGTLRGGIRGDIWGSWLHIRTLWLAPEARGQGLGTELLRRAEQHAAQRGCHWVHLSTFSFQAPALYIKQGYEVFGKLENYPPGHNHFFLKKQLPT